MTTEILGYRAFGPDGKLLGPPSFILPDRNMSEAYDRADRQTHGVNGAIVRAIVANLEIIGGREVQVVTDPNGSKAYFSPLR